MSSTPVSIHAVESVEDARVAEGVFDAIWASPRSKSPFELLRAMSHADCYVTVARLADGTPVGASMGFWAVPGRASLHSHVTGALPGHPGVGFALKQHQRLWVLERGGSTITWTFDPLVRRNAYFNLSKLGATVVGYHENFYGPMDDALNAGEESDRCEVVWDLTAPQRARGLPYPDAEVRLAVGGDEAPLEQAEGADGAFLVQVPADITDQRLAAPAVATQWRHAVRRTLGAAVAAGGRVTAATKDGWLLVEPAARD